MPRPFRLKPPPMPMDSVDRCLFEAQTRGRGLIPVTIYTDGSCPENGIKPLAAPMAAGIVMLSGHLRQEWSIPLGLGSNQIAELEAIRHALLRLKGRDKLVVRCYCDNQYAIGALTNYTWKLKKNVALIEDTRRLLEELAAVEFLHLDGHMGHEGNERCDVLAGTAVRTQAKWKGRWSRGMQEWGEPAASPLNDPGRYPEPTEAATQAWEAVPAAPPPSPGGQ